MSNTTTERPIECVEAATRVLGDKWTPVLLRAIHNQEQVRFCRLQDSVGGINPRTLTVRLAGLERSGIVARCAEEGTRRECYSLTDKGRALIPILQSMAAWGKTYGDTV